MQAYISKEECEKRGFVRGRDGIVRKLNVLERYGRDGWLDYGDRRYSATDRISAGNRLGADFHHAQISSVCANDIRKVKVDGKGSFNRSDSSIDAEDRYRKACQAIPYEFWEVVRRVCCDDEEIKVSGESERQKGYARKQAALLLCLGLDRLINFYKTGGN